jgi:hypothetical protein
VEFTLVTTVVTELIHTHQALLQAQGIAPPPAPSQIECSPDLETGVKGDDDGDDEEEERRLQVRRFI